MFSCPFPIQRYPQITLAHGGGGALSHELVEKLIKPILSSSLESSLDGVELSFSPGQVPLVTTDSFTVQPLFFPDCDIGKLSVIGSTNDLFVCGAIPKFLTCSIILEEGFEISLLKKILESFRATSEKLGVKIICGDTKVVERGKCDGIYFNVTSLGERDPSLRLHPSEIKVGDSVFVSGDLGRHAVSVMIARGKIPFESEVKSDCESLSAPIRKLIDSRMPLRFMKDLTRGGLASNLIESLQGLELSVELLEENIPVIPEVSAFSEVLGLDPLHFACEGRFVLFSDPTGDDKILQSLLSFNPLAKKVGTVLPRLQNSSLWLKNPLGLRRIVDPYRGELLPRIC